MPTRQAEDNAKIGLGHHSTNMTYILIFRNAFLLPSPGARAGQHRRGKRRRLW